MFYDYSVMNIVIAIHSPGAMGSAISARLVEHGARVLTSLDGRSAATVERAARSGDGRCLSGNDYHRRSHPFDRTTW